MDCGAILSRMEDMFSHVFDHEVIKMVLQSCNWDVNEATEKLLILSGAESNTEPPVVTDKINETPDISARSAFNVATDSDKINETANLSSHSAWKVPLHSSTFKHPVTKVQRPNIRSGTEENKLPDILKRIKQQEKILILMRGLPGSGKSSLAQNIVNSSIYGVIHSTDSYFYDEYGKYVFNPSHLSEAHEWNKERAKFSLSSGLYPIIIDNTNIEKWEMCQYIYFALDFGYSVEILEPQTNWRYDPRRLAAHTTHGVPLTKIVDMLQRFKKNVTVESIISEMKLNHGSIAFSQINKNNRSMPKKSEPIVDYDNSDIVIEESESDSQEELEQTFAPKVYQDTCRSSKAPFHAIQPMKVSDIRTVATNFTNQEAEFAHCNVNLDSRNNSATGSSPVKDETFNDLVNSFQHLVRRNRRKERNLSNDYCYEVEDKFSTDKEVCDYYQSCALTPKEEHSISVDTERKSPVNWDSVDPQYLNSAWEQTTADKQSSKDLRQRHRQRQVGNPNKWLTNEKDHHLETNCQIWNPEKTMDAVKWEENTDVMEITIKPNSLTASCTVSDEVQESHQSLGISCRANLSDSTECEAEEENSMLPKGLSILSSLFPNISKRVLKASFDECQQELDWTVGLLLDSGYELHGNIEDYCNDMGTPMEEKVSSDEECEGKSEISTSTDTEEPTPEEVIPPKLESKSPDFDDAVESKSPDFDDAGAYGGAQLTLKMDSLFATQLAAIFGPIGTLSMNGDFCKEDRSIILPLELCQRIHQCWADTLDLKFSQQSAVLDKIIRADEELALQLQKEEEENAQVKDPPQGPSEDEIVPEDPQDYRAEASMHYAERKKFFSMANDASEKGMLGVASHYAQLGKVHTDKFKEANERASKKILQAFNCMKDANQLDLHLLHVKEALLATQSFFSERKQVLRHQNLQKMDVFVITGRGSHSASGQATLKPTVARFLKRNKYQFVEANPGMFKVTITNT